MTWICYRGIELSAETQLFLLSAEIAILGGLLGRRARRRSTTATRCRARCTRAASWFNPFDLSFSALIAGVLLGIFIYWGWDSGVAVNEESRDSAEGPGKAAVLSTILLVLIYVVVATSRQAYRRHEVPRGELERRAQRRSAKRLRLALGQAPDHRRAHVGVRVDADDDPADRADDAVDGEVGRDPGGVRADSSALPDADRLDARHGRALDRLDGVPARRFDPAQNVLNDSITALGFAVCFYYGFTGLACGWYFRRELFKSVRGFLLAGLVPVLGGVMMGFIFVKAFDRGQRRRATTTRRRSSASRCRS